MTSNLIGPFTMDEPPARIGWYCIETRFGEDWRMGDDPLDRYLNIDRIADDLRWYGQATSTQEDSL